MPAGRRCARIATAILTAAGVGLLAVLPAQAHEAQPGEHRVAAGESLTAIARRYCMPLAELITLNGVEEPNLIHVGSPLQVAQRCASSATSPAPAPIPNPAPSLTLSPTAPADPVEVVPLLGLAPVFAAAAVEFGVPADLLMALAFTESRWQNDRISVSGAVGIGQLLPATATWLRALMHEPHLDERQPVDNIRMSARLLRFLLDRTDWHTRTALAAYYQGIGDVLRHGVDARGQRYADLIAERRTWFVAS
jgi:N-acetylmuramoyl-L-alanine amidase